MVYQKKETTEKEWKTIHPDLPPIDSVPAQGDKFDLPDIGRSYDLAHIREQLDSLVTSHQDLVTMLANAHPISLTSGVELTPIMRRRDKQELDRALRTLTSPQARPRDDESEQVLQDAINELFWQRKLTSDLMQLLTTGYQTGLNTIRRMTER